MRKNLIVLYSLRYYRFIQVSIFIFILILCKSASKDKNYILLKLEDYDNTRLFRTVTESYAHEHCCSKISLALFSQKIIK